MDGVTEELLANAAAFAERFDAADLPTAPRRRLAVVACMDSRIDLFALLGLRVGEAHIIRNAGGIVTDDVIRSLSISQRRLGTREIVLVHHTRCGMCTFGDDEFRAEMLAETGMYPPWALETFTDVDDDVRSSMRRVQSSPFLVHREAVRGFVYDVDSGALREVEAPAVPR